MSVKMSLKTLKFSHDYEKLPPNWDGTQAVLVGILYIPDLEQFKNSFPQLFLTDVKFRGEEGEYQFDFNEGILLTFYHLNSNIFFTTIRRYTEDKYRYYESSLSLTFSLQKSKM